MAQKVFMRENGSAGANFHTGLGTNTAKANGSASGWDVFRGITTQGSAAVASAAVSTVAGTTLGLEYYASTATYVSSWITPPLTADFTISGTVTFNVWAYESNAMANTGVQCIVEKVAATTLALTTIINSEQGTELGTTTPPAAARNWTGTPTSTAVAKGDRLRILWLMNDAGGTMASGYTSQMWYGAGAGVNGDTWVQFNENLTFESADPAGSTLYLTDTAGPAVGADVEREMWTSRGAGVQTDVVNTTAGWTAPIRWTDTAGGTVVEWYSKQLTAFTFGGMCTVNVRALKSNSATALQANAEIAVTASDGSGATVWGIAGTEPYAELGTTEAAGFVYVGGDDVSVTDGQRIRLRLYIDDNNSFSMTTGYTATLYYAGTTAGASGDTYVILPQTVTEYTAAATLPPPPTIKQFAVTRSYTY